MEFINDYDYFEVGETWYLTKSEDFCLGDNDEVTHHFEEDSEVIIIDIEKETGYGNAIIEINGIRINVGLDELYDMVMSE